MLENQTIESIIAYVGNELLRQGYSTKTIECHTHIWNRFKRYAAERGETQFTSALAEKFMSETFHYPQEYNVRGALPSKIVNQLRAIRILQNFCMLGMLPQKLKPAKQLWPEKYLRVYEKYRASCAVNERSNACVAQYLRTAQQFVEHMEEKSVSDWADISSSTVESFIGMQQGYTKHTVKMRLRTLKTFLNYLYEEGLVHTDFSYCVPHVRIYSKGHIPATLSKEQTEKMLSNFDRGNPIGKRDYAIVLLAIELGLRSSDISGLRFENIDWKRKQVCIVQEKTENVLELPLPNHVANAIIDYLKNGRPKSKAFYIFVKHKAPYDQFHELYDVMGRALKSAGISLEKDVSKGLHILRHTLATNLLEQGVPLPTIAEILGQRNVTTTEIYLHADIENLKKCALDPEVVLHE